MKSETLNREAIKNYCDKVLKGNSSLAEVGANLFIVQNYTKNVYGDLPLHLEMCGVFSFFEFKVSTCFYSMTIT